MQNFHSIKTLVSLGLSKETAKALRDIVKAESSADIIILHKLDYSDHGRVPPAYKVRLDAANKILGGYGVESAIESNDGYLDSAPTYVDYVNVGDSYHPTLCRIVKQGKARYVYTDYANACQIIGL